MIIGVARERYPRDRGSRDNRVLCHADARAVASNSMFERFTDRARQVVVLAQERRELLCHNYIGTEHLLLGLLREEKGLAAHVLESLDITVERCARRSRGSSVRATRQCQARSRSRRAPRKCSSSRCARRSRSVTTTSTPSTSCSGSCARTRASPRGSCSTSTQTPRRSAARSSGMLSVPGEADAGDRDRPHRGRDERAGSTIVEEGDVLPQASVLNSLGPTAGSSSASVSAGAGAQGHLQAARLLARQRRRARRRRRRR